MKRSMHSRRSLALRSLLLATVVLLTSASALANTKTKKGGTQSGFHAHSAVAAQR